MAETPERTASPALVPDSEVTTAAGESTDYDGSTRAPSPEADRGLPSHVQALFADGGLQRRSEAIGSAFDPNQLPDRVVELLSPDFVSRVMNGQSTTGGTYTSTPINNPPTSEGVGRAPVSFGSPSMTDRGPSSRLQNSRTLTTPFSQAGATEPHSVLGGFEGMYRAGPHAAQSPTPGSSRPYSPQASRGSPDQSHGASPAFQPASLRYPNMAGQPSPMPGPSVQETSTDSTDTTLEARLKFYRDKEAGNLQSVQQEEKRREEGLQTYGPLPSHGFCPADYTFQSGRWELTQKAAELDQQRKEAVLQAFGPIASHGQRRQDYRRDPTGKWVKKADGEGEE